MLALCICQLCSVTLTCCFAVQDVTTVWARVQAAAVVHDSAERRALSPSRARSPSPVRDGSLAAEKLKNSNAADPAAVSFHVVVEVSLPNLTQQAFLNDSVDENQAAFVPVTKMQDVQFWPGQSLPAAAFVIAVLLCPPGSFFKMSSHVCAMP